MRPCNIQTPLRPSRPTISPRPFRFRTMTTRRIPPFHRPPIQPLFQPPPASLSTRINSTPSRTIFHSPISMAGAIYCRCNNSRPLQIRISAMLPPNLIPNMTRRSIHLIMVKLSVQLCSARSKFRMCNINPCPLPPFPVNGHNRHPPLNSSYLNKSIFQLPTTIVLTRHLRPIIIRLCRTPRPISMMHTQ